MGAFTKLWGRSKSQVADDNERSGLVINQKGPQLHETLDWRVKSLKVPRKNHDKLIVCLCFPTHSLRGNCGSLQNPHYSQHIPLGERSQNNPGILSCPSNKCQSSSKFPKYRATCLFETKLLFQLMFFCDKLKQIRLWYEELLKKSSKTWHASRFHRNKPPTADNPAQMSRRTAARN